MKCIWAHTISLPSFHSRSLSLFAIFATRAWVIVQGRRAQNFYWYAVLENVGSDNDDCYANGAKSRRFTDYVLFTTGKSMA